MVADALVPYSLMPSATTMLIKEYAYRALFYGISLCNISCWDEIYNHFNSLGLYSVQFHFITFMYSCRNVWITKKNVPQMILIFNEDEKLCCSFSAMQMYEKEWHQRYFGGFCGWGDNHNRWRQVSFEKEVGVSVNGLVFKLTMWWNVESLSNVFC